MVNNMFNVVVPGVGVLSANLFPSNAILFYSLPFSPHGMTWNEAFAVVVLQLPKP